MSQNDTLMAVIECRKLAHYYFTRESDPMSDEERLGLANLLVGVADLIIALHGDTAEVEEERSNVIDFPRRATH